MKIKPFIRAAVYVVRCIMRVRVRPWFAVIAIALTAKNPAAPAMSTKSIYLRYTPINPGVGDAFVPALGAKEASGTNKRAAVFNSGTNSEIDRFGRNRLP